MAIRNVRVMGDEVLTKRCKEVTIMTPRIKTLIDDMIDTMYEANGVGLAACQVGVLKRIVVIDTTGDELYVFPYRTSRAGLKDPTMLRLRLMMKT